MLLTFRDVAPVFFKAVLLRAKGNIQIQNIAYSETTGSSVYFSHFHKF